MSETAKDPLHTAALYALHKHCVQEIVARRLAAQLISGSY